MPPSPATPLIVTMGFPVTYPSSSFEFAENLRPSHFSNTNGYVHFQLFIPNSDLSMNHLERSSTVYYIVMRIVEKQFHNLCDKTRNKTCKDL